MTLTRTTYRVLSIICLVAAVLAFLFGATNLRSEPARPTFTNAHALGLLVALRGLDGRPVITKDNTAVTLPWEFGSGGLRMRITKNITALMAVEKLVEDSRLAIVKEVGKGAEIKQGTPEWDSLIRQLDDVLKQPAVADLSRIRASELRLDKNEIPGGVLSGLAPILDDDVTPK